MKNISGKVAIVTGSSSGVGAATANLLAASGCHVAINFSRSEESAQAVARSCEKHGVETVVCRANVAEDGDCQRLVNAAIEKWGQVDILVNNAGTTKFCDHHQLDGLDAVDFQRIYSVNVVGVYQMTRAVHRHLENTDRNGDVVNVASTAAITGIGSSVAYAASKGALVTMTLSLARALGPKLRINAVCPGFIQGDWLRKGLGDEVYERFMAQNEQSAPLGVTATAETVAEAILHFIVGPQIVTGETLIVDGGRHLTQTPLTRR
ncbi:MAG: SDR family oxidoreductase [Pseudohongiellaceae bacterium]